nr:FimV/HubP family polar landmark protein [uncultured Marinobacter sp.]
MKVRKLAVALALAGGLGSSVAQALGLGEIELQSYLNEPLDAEIILPQSRGVSPGDVFVNIAPESAYERVGLQRNQFLSKLRFEVVTHSDGRLAVNVSSREPFREPYLNFLIELTWPNGRLMREYAVLVDPPVYAEESGVDQRVSAPTTTAIGQESSSREQESLRRQTRAERSLERGYQANTVGPTGPSDTLWTIASRTRPGNQVSMQQVMLAIQDLNPDAFIDGNINRLKRGEVLRLPSLEQIQSRTRAEAIQVVSQQNQEFQSPRRTVDATDAAPAQGQPASGAAGGDELKLLVVDNDGGREQDEGGSAGGDGELPGGVDAGTAVAMEQLESAKRENEELTGRVDDLQDQVETLQRLLELKNSQLADLQQMAVEDQAAQPAGQGAAENTPEGVSSGAVGSDTDVAGDEATATGPESAQGTGEGAGQPAQDGTTGDAATDAAMATTEAAPADESAPETGEAAMGESPESADGGATAPAEQPESAAPTATEQPEPVTPEPPVADKGFPGNVIDAITGNPIYQIALGGGLIVLLLLLLLLARRNANREKAFYEQLNGESDNESDGFDLTLDGDGEAEEASSDALAEADTYVAYGRLDQAAQTLETAISREPSRTDLRLKLLAVYADSQDRDSFEKQYGEIEALDDEQALEDANDLRIRLEEAESMPSIDDLESQLRTDSFGSPAQDRESGDASGEGADEGADEAISDELLADQYDADKEGEVENEFGDFDSDFADFDLDEVEDAEKATDSGESSDDQPAESADDGMIEYDLSGLDSDTDLEEPSEKPEADTEETDYSSLEMDLEDVDKPSSEMPAESEDDDYSLDFESSAPAGEEKTGAETETGSLDESFLDELDAELDKVAGDDDELGGEEIEESSLDDLELDVSDEDLALMEEFSDSADSSNHDDEDSTPSLDEELGLEDTLAEGDVLGEGEESSPEEEVAGVEELDNLGALDEIDDLQAPAETDSEQGDEDDLDLPVASDEVKESAPKPAVSDIDESDLGDDDDFDFLAGTDEAATKLDLARAYIEMGDNDGARDILEEVALEGDDEQKAEAQDLLKNLS